MGIRDLRKFIEAVDSFGELRRIEGADPNLKGWKARRRPTMRRGAVIVRKY